MYIFSLMQFEKRNGSTSSSNYLSITLRKPKKYVCVMEFIHKSKLPTDQRKLNLSCVEYDTSSCIRVVIYWTVKQQNVRLPFWKIVVTCSHHKTVGNVLGVIHLHYYILDNYFLHVDRNKWSTIIWNYYKH